MDRNNLQKFEIRYDPKTIIKRWYIILSMIILALLFSYYKGYDKTITIYQAKIGLIVGNPIGGQGTKFQIADVQVYERFIQTYCALAKTSLVAEKVSDKLNKRISGEDIQNSISAVPQASTQFINVTITWGDPKGAIDILNTFSEVFMSEAKSIYPDCTIQVMENIKEPKPIIISKRTYFILMPIAGVVFAILIIFGIELLDKTIKTEEDIKECLNGSVIGEIPKDKNMIKKINSASLKDINPIMLEAYRTLRTNIEFTASCNSLKSIIITSARPMEGKTLTAAMLAQVIAKTGKRVILLDCDLRNPNIHKIFSVVNEMGLTNYLAGKATLTEAIKRSSIENLYILTTGIKPPNPAELLSSSQMRTLIRVLKNDYDYIIIDTPPVGLVTDAQILSQIVDGSIFVISSGKSVRNDTVKSKELIRQVGGNIIGFILNNVKYSNTYKKYSYYYKGDKKSKAPKFKKT